MNKGQSGGDADSAKSPSGPTADLRPLGDEVVPAVKTLIADAVRMFRRNGFADCAPYKESLGEIFLCRDNEAGTGLP